MWCCWQNAAIRSWSTKIFVFMGSTFIITEQKGKPLVRPCDLKRFDRGGSNPPEVRLMRQPQEDAMENDYQSLAHSRWDCKYHVVFVPKRRRRQLSGEIRRQLGAIFHALARQKECQIIEGHVMPDHVHMCIAIPPKVAVAQVIGFLKGKSAIAIARQFGGKERNFTGEHFWARGMRCPRWGLNWSKSAPTSASKTTRIRTRGASSSFPADRSAIINSGDRL